MSRLGWYTRRLSTMSAGEVLWRAGSTARAAVADRRPEPTDTALLGTAEPDGELLRNRFRAAADRPVLLDRGRAERIRAGYPERVAALIAAADRIVDGRVRYFGYPAAQLADPVDWHHDIGADVRWPALPARRLDHRSAAGDAKWIWELNRLQHLPWLAQAWLHTGDDRYAETAFAHLESWCAQNPSGTGIAWRGAFEVGVRAISVAVALQGLRDSALCTPERYLQVLRLLAESARRCWADRSRFSSANNHLVGELAGLAVIALLHPELARSSRDLDRALAGLAAEANLQILPDGGGAEQAVAYQIFTADLLLVVAALLRRAGRPVPGPIGAALRRGAVHLAVLVRDGEPVPRFGDDDEGFALRLDTEETPDLRRHLGAVAAVTGDPVARQYGDEGLTAAWLAAPDAGTETREVPESAYFPDTGLVVLRGGGRRVTMDVGPLGYLGIAAHGHADALAVSLAEPGRDLVGDPGAGSYYGHPGWRAAHRSTAAHATVTVDGQDQSVPGGPFLWTQKAAVTVRSVDLHQGVVDAEHDGYTRFDSPVTHRRWLVAPPDEVSVLIVDLLSGHGAREVAARWPLHPRLEPLAGQHSPGRFTDGGELALTVLQATDHGAVAPLAVHGDPDTHLGWWSDRLEAREPSWVVGNRVVAELPVVVATLLHPADGSGVAPSGLTVSRAGTTITVRWMDESVRQVTVYSERIGGVLRSVGQTES